MSEDFFSSAQIMLWCFPQKMVSVELIAFKWTRSFQIAMDFGLVGNNYIPN